MPANAAPPSAAPPSFYDNLPAGGDAAAGNGGAGQKPKEKDGDGELLKGAQGMYRVAQKMSEMRDEIKPYTDKIKEAIKALLVKGLKLDPGMLDDSGGSGDKGGSGGASDAGAPPAPPAGGGAPPSQKDETHSA